MSRYLYGLLFMLIAVLAFMSLSGCAMQKGYNYNTAGKTWLIGDLEYDMRSHVLHTIEGSPITECKIGGVYTKGYWNESVAGDRGFFSSPVICYGRMKNVTVQEPVSKEVGSPTRPRTITYFDPDSIARYSSFNISYPPNATTQQPFEVRVKFTNELPVPIHTLKARMGIARVSPLNGSVTNEKDEEWTVDLIDVNETKELSLQYEASEPGSYDFTIKMTADDPGSNVLVSIADGARFEVS